MNPVYFYLVVDNVLQEPHFTLSKTRDLVMEWFKTIHPECEVHSATLVFEPKGCGTLLADCLVEEMVRGILNGTGKQG